MVASTPTTITLSDVTSGIEEDQDADFYIAGVADIGNPASAECLDSGSATVTVTAQPFTAPTSITQSNCALRGGSNYDATLTISITVVIFIPENGEIIIEIS